MGNVFKKPERSTGVSLPQLRLPKMQPPLANIDLRSVAVRGNRHGLLLILPVLFISTLIHGIPRKIVLFRYNAGIITTLSHSCDECCHPRSESVIKNSK
jgi:hypothetical protein